MIVAKCSNRVYSANKQMNFGFCPNMQATTMDGPAASATTH